MVLTLENVVGVILSGYSLSCGCSYEYLGLTLLIERLNLYLVL